MLEGTRMPAALDLGAEGSIVNWRAARRAGVGVATSLKTRRGWAAGGLGNGAIKAEAHDFRVLRLGEVSFAEPTLFIADLPFFKALGLGYEPAMILGLDLLSTRVLIIDYAGRTAYV